jgi:MYXO-CTERM domain-containing protein
VSNLPFAGKAGYVTRFAIDETHTNPYSVWAGQNKPSAPSEAQWQEMRKAQHLMPVEPITKTTFDASYTATFAIPKQGASMIILGVNRPLTGRNALVEIEGEDFDGQMGITKEDSGDTSMGQSISAAANGYAYFENVDYTDAGVDTVELRVKTAADTTVELHSETPTGALLGTCMLTSTSNAWATQSCKLAQAATGVSKLYVVFGGAAHLNWLKFEGEGNPPMGTGGAGGMSTSGGNAAQGTAGSAGASVASGGGAAVGTGGSAGQNPGAGGNVSGGNDGAGGRAGSGTSPGGGNNASGGMGPSGTGTGGSASPGDSDGCGCRVGGSDRPQGTALVLGLLLGALGLRRRGAAQQSRAVL